MLIDDISHNNLEWHLIKIKVGDLLAFFKFGQCDHTHDFITPKESLETLL